MSRSRILFLVGFFLLFYTQAAYAAEKTEMMVVLRQKPNTSALLKISSTLTNEKAELKSGIPNSKILLYSVDGDATTASRKLKTDPNVAIAAPVPKLRIQAAPNDPYFSSEWGMTMTKIVGSSVDAWSKFTDLGITSNVKVAVIDTGVDSSHPDLVGKIDSGDWIVCSDATSPNCIPTTGGVDDNGHGTHVAGIIAATGNNGIGISGGGAGTKIMSIKALNSQGEGSLTSVLYGAAYALDHGVKIINFSLGAPETTLSADQIVLIQSAITEIWNAGGLLVVAGGNCGDGLDSFCGGTNPKMYPAASNNVLSVGAVTSSAGLASYSARGDWVKVAAPGGNCSTNSEAGCILSTWSSRGASCPTINSPSGYCFDQGTSMSTPFVSAIAALILAKYPSLTNQNLIEIIQTSASSTNIGVRYGLVDAVAAMNLAATYSQTTLTPIPTSSVTPILTQIPTVTPTGTIIPTSTIPTPTISSILITDIPRLPKSQASIPTGLLCTFPCTLRSKGDANCDGVINTQDVDTWARHFDTVMSASSLTPVANFICTEGNLPSEYIDLVDFEAWRRNTSQFLPN